MTYVIAELCVDVMDRSCVEECPVDCIYEGAADALHPPDECVDCGACEPVCPIEAIYYEDDLPEQWSVYTRINAEFFDAHGSPGGAARLGRTGNDHRPLRPSSQLARTEMTPIGIWQVQPTSKERAANFGL